jgi:hypothetical protein
MPRIEIKVTSRQINAKGLILRPDGSQIPREFKAAVSGMADLPGAVVEMDVAVDDFGNVRCRKLSISDEGGVTGTGLRQLQMKAMLEEVALAASDFIGRRSSVEGLTAASIPSGQRTAEKYTRRHGQLRAPRQGSPITPENLKTLAGWVRQAHEDGTAPVSVVQAKANVSKATAYRWIKAARESGLDLGEGAD